MGFNYLTVYGTAPELDPHLRRAQEERAAVVYATWTASKRAVSAAVHGLVESFSRARRARRTFRALNDLSDRQLRDIGLNRAEIDSVAETLAAAAPETGIAVADLRRSGILHSASQESSVVSLARDDKRPSARIAWPAMPPASEHERAAA